MLSNGGDLVIAPGTAYLETAFIYWWLGIRHAKKQVNISKRFVCHTATDHYPDIWDLSAHFIVRIIRWQHTVARQVRRALWRQPRRPRLVGTRCTLLSRLYPLRFTLNRTVRVPLSRRKFLRRFKQHNQRCQICGQRWHYKEQKHRSRYVISLSIVIPLSFVYHSSWPCRKTTTKHTFIQVIC